MDVSSITKAAAMALLGLGLTMVALPAQEALAKGKRVEKAQLARPVRAQDADAEGNVRIRHGRKADRITVRLRHLDPRTNYTVRDADTDEVLGTVTTNRRGKGKLRVKRRRQVDGKAATTEDVDSVAVYKEGSDVFVLVGGPNDEFGFPGDFDPSFGDGFYGTLLGPNASISMFTDGADHDSFYAALSVDTGDGRQYLEYYAESVGDETLPLGVDSVSDLAERPFVIEDAEGDEVVAGDLPEMQDLVDFTDGFVLPEPPELGEDDDRKFVGPFTLRIEDDEGTLQDVGEFESIDYGFDDDFLTGCLFFGSWEEGANGSVSLYSDEFGECLVVDLCVPGEGEGDRENAAGIWDKTYYSYDQSRTDGRGSLPFDVEELADLEGRAFEIRNGDGDAIVADDLPEMTNEFFDLGIENGEVIDAGPAPYTLWLADEDGTLTELGELTEWDGGIGFPPPEIPDDFEAGVVFFGDLEGEGAFGTISMQTEEGYQSLSAFFSTYDRTTGGDFYELYFDRKGDEGDLPLGVTDLHDLEGRAFELRNGDGDAFVDGELPELLGLNSFPGLPDFGTTIVPGDGPYTLWIADENGTLTKVGELEKVDFGGFPGIDDDSNGDGNVVRFFKR